ncbi:helix-turn-helix transcriptional regulator [Amycolatopsis orientalis]|uniref:Helix-turn-helix transcriptional regulator n=1 Tax=Amycolatopsis orientalis TaxID=31958 RepID=A0A193BUT9_AMYOR|nr:LuxR family transcriptional regulator [Amycolatopsis orientalis]ANN15986.1 helix-turn-helix transcriptional regulator [Amycolatopsis orientalis]
MTLEHAGPDAPGCQARTALEMLSRGTDRLGTASQAELVFTDKACSQDVRCVWHGMTILLRAGELESADEHLWRLEHDRRGWWDDHVTLMRAEHAMHAGDLVGSRAALARLTATALPESLRDLALPCYLEVLVAVNEAELANQVLRQHDFDLLQRKWPTLYPLLLAVRGWLHLISGRTEQAYRDLRKCSRLPATEVAATYSVARRRGVLALAAAATGEHEVALAAATQEYEVAKAWRSHAHLAWGLYVLEMIEDSDQPSDRFRDAIDLLELARSPSGIATVCYEQGKRLLASGEHSKGRAHLLRAEKSARRIGDAVLTEKIEKLLCELTNSEQRTPLTMQELRIAELTQNGYSNKQIADRLVLTVRTVEFHLSNVYRKLEIPGRRALAAEILPSRLN